MSRFFEIKMKADMPQALDLYIYSDIEGDSEDWWTGEKIESETSAAHFRDVLLQAGDVSQINVYINSAGGSVMEGLAIYNQLKRHKAHKTVYIDGFACSIASVIAMAGDEIIMPLSSMMYIHEPMGHVFGYAADLRKEADNLDKVKLSVMQAYLIKSGGKLTADKLVEIMAQADYWSAEDCLAFGLADKISDTDIDINKALQDINKTAKKAEDRKSAVFADFEKSLEKLAAKNPVLQLTEKADPEEPDGGNASESDAGTAKSRTMSSGNGTESCTKSSADFLEKAINKFKQILNLKEEM